MNGTDDVMPTEVSQTLSSEVTELDNPVLEQAVATNASTVAPRAERDTTTPNEADSAMSASSAIPDSSMIEGSSPPEENSRSATTSPSNQVLEAIEDPWETVDFPDAVIPIEQLPEGESIDILTSLEQQNQTLRDRVTYLETTLETAQTNLCQEVARWESLALAGDERLQEQVKSQEQTIAKYVDDLTATQKKVTELFSQLELSHQTAQRQQVIMESINTQLHNSQERVAQLERECAGVHQQNIEQAQQVLQQSHQIRDLHARLHRQQRYALQYKAALEKSLEVPSNAPTTPTLLSETTATQLGAKKVNIPKPTPVQPWSAPDPEADDASQKAWLNSFMSDSETLPTTEVSTNFDWQPSTELGDSHVSFNLEESSISDADIDALNEQLSASESTSLQGPTTSPFITLQSSQQTAPSNDSEVKAEAFLGDNGESDGVSDSLPKLESIGAVDLPTFHKGADHEAPEINTTTAHSAPLSSKSSSSDSETIDS